MRKHAGVPWQRKMRPSVGELWVFIEKVGEREGVQWGGQRPGGVYVSPELFVLVHPVS